MSAGFVGDAVPAFPEQWGYYFVIPAVPPEMWAGGYTIGYLSWFVNQGVRITFIDGTVEEHSYTGNKYN